jgi:hypothetical protein
MRAGGGNYDTQVRLYHSSDKSPIIVIVENGYNPPFPEDFLAAKMTIRDLRVLKSIGAQVYVKLYPKSTVPIAYLSINEDMTRAICGGNNSVVVADKSPYLHYCKHPKEKYSAKSILSGTVGTGVLDWEIKRMIFYRAASRGLIKIGRPALAKLKVAIKDYGGKNTIRVCEGY